ncbi:MAG: hypothetical protein AAGB24_14810, partial [Bacteroidota bacterium]
FVQWGNSGNVRESVAVAAGIWNAGGYVPNVAPGSSIAYDGEGNTSDDWAEATTPTLGAANNSGTNNGNSTNTDQSGDGSYYGDNSDNGSGY